MREGEVTTIEDALPDRQCLLHVRSATFRCLFHRPCLQQMCTAQRPVKQSSKLRKLRQVKNTSSATNSQNNGVVAATAVSNTPSHNISHTWFSGPRVIVDDVTASLGPGVTVVLGPSGAGKTTFLDVLAGKVSRSGTLSGDVLLDG